MGWSPFNNNTTVGERGSEAGVIVRDDEHERGARITLERDGHIAPFAITCGIYGWMFHTRFLSTRQEADAEFDAMKLALASILELASAGAEPNSVASAIGTFVDRFP